MDLRRSSHTYRVLKSSWGIWISITATIHLGQVSTAPPSPGLGQTALAFDGTAAKLPDAYRTALQEGWSRVASDAARSAGDRVRVVVEEVKFVDTDFQVEGLPVAMVRWAEHAFGLDERHIEVSFDRAGNRYRFEWGPRR